MDEVKRLLHELDVPIYDERTRQGDIRIVIARIGRAAIVDPACHDPDPNESRSQIQ